MNHLQYCAILVVLTVSLAPVVRCLGVGRWRMAAVIVLAFAALSWANTRLPSSFVHDAETAAALPKQSAADEFVSSATCRACHPGEYASWHKTFHRTMTQLATPASVQAPFAGVKLQLEGKTYKLSRDGDEYFVEMPDPDYETLLLSQGERLGSHDEVRVARRQVVLTTGSHRFQDYWVASRDGKGLYHVPWEYHITEKRWMPLQDAHVAPPSEPRGVTHWNSICIACHAVNGSPGMNPWTDGWATEVAEYGISCEACHGPGERHVTHHRNPLNRYRQHRDEESDPTIVNPARLSSKDATSICGRCHSTFRFIDKLGSPNRMEFLMHGSAYRAGGDLAKFIRVLSPLKPGKGVDTAFRQVYWNENDVRDSYWRDGTARIGGREYLGLLESPCFVKGEMSCLSCHSMHNSDPAGQVADRMGGNQACLQCHESIGRDVAAHTHHKPGGSGSLCYNCHMPHTSYALFRSVRAHRIDSPSVASSVRSGRPNACNLCHLDKTLEWSAHYLSDWYAAEPVELTAEQRTVAASLLWLLKGDAGQRAVTVGNTAWKQAQEVSLPMGWQVPVLATLLEDPYSVVRYMAALSLKTLPRFSDFEFDHVGSEAHRAEAKRQVLQAWQRHWSDRLPEPIPRLLLEAGARIQEEQMQKLLDQRDDSPVRFTE